MRRHAAPFAAALILAGCANPAAHVPPFARKPYDPFSRAAVVAIARDEWRAFGSPIDDAPPGAQTVAAVPVPKPERLDGLWQRVGLYWWLGLNAGAPESGWTGKHDGEGRVFPSQADGRYAWSAAFVSYVMRIAGAGRYFPYAAAHHVYINIAYERAIGRARRDWLVSAASPASYAPRPGDLICMSRTDPPLRFADLPAGRFAAHCDIVVGATPGALEVIGGNVDDAVTLKHVPVTPQGLLNDPRYPWFVVLRVLAP